MAKSKVYIFIGENCTDPKGRELQKGDACELTDSQFKAFGDKFKLADEVEATDVETSSEDDTTAMTTMAIDETTENYR